MTDFSLLIQTSTWLRMALLLILPLFKIWVLLIFLTLLVEVFDTCPLNFVHEVMNECLT